MRAIVVKIILKSKSSPTEASNAVYEPRRYYMSDLQRMLGVKSYSAVMRAVIRGDAPRPQKGAYRLYWLEEELVEQGLLRRRAA
jgi:hypothetical protein